VLIVGGGKIGLEKLNAIVQNTTRRSVLVVATEFNDELLNLAESAEGITLHQKQYSPSDLANIDLAICAANDPLLSKDIWEDAHSIGLLINVADTPDLCDFYLGSVVRKGQLKIGISTNGKSPTIAKRLKEVLNESIPDDFDSLLENMSRLRKKLNGDLSTKVAKLNEITSILVNDEKASTFKEQRTFNKLVFWSSFALLFLFAGNVIAKYATVDDLFVGLEYLNRKADGKFYLMILTGFVAQMIDGALGMGFGVTCTSALLAIGIPLPAISGSIHTAEVFSLGASGISHYRFGNVNRKMLRWLLIPGVVGAFTGAFLLSRFGQQYAMFTKPALAIYTLILGLKILRNAFKKKKSKSKLNRLGLLGGVAGFLDSFGGGGWGPLVTSTLLSRGKSRRYVVGTVSLSKFFITTVSALTFFIMIGISHWQVICGLIIGGLVAAPLAARLSGRLPQKLAFVGVGILIIIWSMNILLNQISH
jgi:siroheme synthase-like protein